MRVGKQSNAQLRYGFFRENGIFRFPDFGGIPISGAEIPRRAQKRKA